MRLSRQFQACLFIYLSFFCEKVLSVKKTLTSKNKPKKNKTKQTLSNKYIFYERKNVKVVMRVGAFFTLKTF